MGFEGVHISRTCFPDGICSKFMHYHPSLCSQILFILKRNNYGFHAYNVSCNLYFFFRFQSGYWNENEKIVITTTYKEKVKADLDKLANKTLRVVTVYVSIQGYPNAINNLRLCLHQENMSV